MMENNFFYANRNAIKMISEKENVPVDIAVEMWMKRNSIPVNANADDRQAFMAEIRKYELDPDLTLGDFFG